MTNSNNPSPYRAEYHVDSIGRRRKLNAAAMARIRREFYHGMPATQLAKEWGVSVSLIRSVCYNTPRKADLIRLGLELPSIPSAE